MKLINLFIAFFKVGLLSFGGGYTLIPLIEYQVVKEHSWLTQEEFLQILGASQAIAAIAFFKINPAFIVVGAGIAGIVLFQ